MTIPIQMPQIQPPLAPPQKTVAEQIAPILEIIAQQKLANAQLESYRSLAEERKMTIAKQARDLQDQADAANAFYQHLSGAAVRVKPEPPSKDGTPSHQGVDNTTGTLIPLPQFEKGLNPGALVHYHQLVQDYNQTVLQRQQETASQAQVQHTQTLDTIAQQGMDEDRQISAVLNRFAGKPWTQNTMNQAIGQVVAINPQKAGQVATALAAMMPNYTPHVNERGDITFLPNKPGPTVGAPLQPARPTDEQAKVGNYGVRVLEANAIMTRLENKSPGIGQRVDAKISTVRSVEQYPGVGRALATKALRVALASMTPEERLYWNARTDIGNALLRRASGAQINMEELDRETSPYVPLAGEDEGVVQSKQARRLQQGLLFGQQAGNAWDPNKLSPDARRYLLAPVIPHPGYSPDNPFVAQPGTTTVPKP